MKKCIIFVLPLLFSDLPASAVMNGLGQDIFPVAAVFQASATITYVNAANAGLTVSSGLVVQNGTVGIGTTTPQGLLHVGAGAAPGLLVTSAGNVGVGTTGPSYKLDVQGGNASAGAIYDAVGFGNIPSISIANTNTTANNWAGLAFGYNAAGGNAAAIASQLVNHTTGEGLLSFGTTNSAGTIAERMRITSDGKVGIGTTVPGSALTVQTGDIQTRGVGNGLIVKDSTDGVCYKIYTNGGSLSVSNVACP